MITTKTLRHAFGITLTTATTTTTVVAAVLLISCGFPTANAQTPLPSQIPSSAPPPPPAPATSTPPSSAPQTPSPTSSSVAPEPDLSITANVTARELRFEVVPDPTVEFTGQPRRETVWEADRENLPRPVQPGTTYRDIGIRLRITSLFADIDRIVAEALGEVPVTSDDAPPPQSAPPAAAATTAMPPPPPPQRPTRGGTRP